MSAEIKWEFLRESDLPMGAVINGTTIQDWRVDRDGVRWVKCKIFPKTIRGVTSDSTSGDSIEGVEE